MSAGVPAHSLESYGAVQFLSQNLRPRDVVLVKASRGVRAERVVEGLIDKLGRAG